jgi:hypothetical protein
MQSQQLINTLIEQTQSILISIEKLETYSTNKLTWKHNPNSWSILECVQHLNLYGDFYLPQIEVKLNKSNTQPDVEFKSGLLGNYFAKSMLPQAKLNKLKTFKDKNPLNNILDKSVINKFITQQQQLQVLLNKARGASLNKIKITTSISRFIKLKLGDAFQFYINHIIRHLAQISTIEKEMDN